MKQKKRRSEMANQFLEELKEIARQITHVEGRMDAFGVEIRKEFSIAALKDQLLTLPGQIKDAQVLALQKKKELSDFEQQQMGQRVAEMFFEIGNEKGENGKAIFTNNPTRKAELTIRLDEDEQYLVLKKKCSIIESKAWESGAEVDKLRDDFRSRLAIKDLVCAELKLYTK